jgi:hypothetical protein
MRGQQPMHPAAQVAIVDRPESQVEVIGHDTLGAQPDGCRNPASAIRVTKAW